MNFTERNLAGEHLVVGSLHVISDMKGPGITQIRHDIQQTKTAATELAKKQEAYWASLSDDGEISPLEKKVLKKELEGITQSYTALVNQARSLQLDTQTYFLDYVATYQDLYSYIYATLKLFDDMNSSTEISSRVDFNSRFTAYYYMESYTTIALTSGILDNQGFKILTSLSDEGNDGDIGIYRGVFYQYYDLTWHKLDAADYLGPLAQLPVEPKQNQFFIALNNFDQYEPFYVNGSPFYVNGEQFYVYERNYEKGVIYVYTENHWQPAEATDWRYLSAIGDYYSITGEYPAVLQITLDEMVDNIKVYVDDSIEEVLVDSHPPTYLGPSISSPANPGPGDYFLYTGATVSGSIWVKNRLYKWDSEQDLWVFIDPEDGGEDTAYYMNALQDILLQERAGSGYFSVLFCNAFFANNAFFNNLSVYSIKLRKLDEDHEGVIVSDQEQYLPGTRGLRIDSAGNIDANGTNIHFGSSAGSVDITPSAVTLTGTIAVSQGSYLKLPVYDSEPSGFTSVEGATYILK